ncbi:hypothetical protein J4209_04710 [Candidatus Woesearchaeota archaeon]|nr:hypothetical protein [Candidatus Woesearchaeota archaeon]
MVILDDDMEFAKDLRIKRNQKKTDFQKLLNKKDLTGFELDELFNDELADVELGGNEGFFEEEE